jgi:hypothetical protein
MTALERVLAVGKKGKKKPQSKREAKTYASAQMDLVWTAAKARELLTKASRYYKEEAKRTRLEIVRLEKEEYWWASIESHSSWKRKQKEKIRILKSSVKAIEMTERIVGSLNFRKIDEDLVALLNREQARDDERERNTNAQEQSKLRQEERDGIRADRQLMKIRKALEEAEDLDGFMKRTDAYLVAIHQGKPLPKRPTIYEEREKEAVRLRRKEFEHIRDHDPEMWAIWKKDTQAWKFIKAALKPPK